MKRKPEIDVLMCKRCNLCVRSCPEEAIFLTANNCCAKCIKYCIVMPVSCWSNYIEIDYSRCNSCGLCIEKCAGGAIIWSGADA